MSLTASLAAGGAGFAAVAVLTGLVRAVLRRHGVMDRPNERSSHAGPVPRGGGIAVVGVLIAAWLALWLSDACQGCGALFWVALAGALGLAAISWLDDLRGGLSALLRLLAQVAAVGAGIASLPGDALVFQGALPALVDHALAAAAWLWFVNLFNFMDGIDGISGAEGASLGLGTFLLVLLGVAPAGLGPLGLALAGVSLGFLLWNWNPAKIFLGDVGSVPLGYLAGWLLLALATAGAWQAALLLPAYYLADATFTIARRLLRGRRIWGSASRAPLSAGRRGRVEPRAHDRTDRRPQSPAHRFGARVAAGHFRCRRGTRGRRAARLQRSCGIFTLPLGQHAARRNRLDMRRIGTRLIVRRAYMVAAHDVAMAGASFALALLLRYGLVSFWELSSSFIIEGMLLFSAVAALVFWRMRIYRGVWRYTALRDVVLVVQTVSLAVLIFVPILFALTRLEGYPRSAFLINWFILIAPFGRTAGRLPGSPGRRPRGRAAARRRRGAAHTGAAAGRWRQCRALHQRHDARFVLELPRRRHRGRRRKARPGVTSTASGFWGQRPSCRRSCAGSAPEGRAPTARCSRRRTLTLTISAPCLRPARRSGFRSPACPS